MFMGCLGGPNKTLSRNALQFRIKTQKRINIGDPLSNFVRVYLPERAAFPISEIFTFDSDLASQEHFEP